ncbi:aminotransferase class I/II-fold pyridoxal phosphate-dependent enzyme, partial [Salmonella sp. s54925]|uniref:aminotransferase class I/II-fold pyridoxal phosphate-dependent enzyme n=1 Tax=Salmonella sp. s54925 TaxID=3159674 RepID=UPI003980B389
SMREILFQKMRENATPGNWEHVVKHRGMFTFTGLTPKQVKFLLEKYHVYILGNGRINMCAITTTNVDYVAKAFDDAVRSVKD